MKKTILYSLFSFLFGVASTVLIGGNVVERMSEFKDAILIPADISNAGNMIRLIDEKKYAAVRDWHVRILRCKIEEYEEKNEGSKNFSSDESLQRTKERYQQYTGGLGCVE